MKYGCIDDEVWIQGVSVYMPEAWIKGKKVSDGIVEFDSPQFAGLWEPGDRQPMWVYIESADEGEEVAPWGDVLSTFTPVDNFRLIKSDSGRWSCNMTMCLSANNVVGEMSSSLGGEIETYRDAKLYTYDNIGKSEVPAKPEVLVCQVFEGTTMGYMQYELPQVSVSGNLLNPDCLYYEVYMDGKLHSFENLSGYPGESVSLIPYRYMDNSFIASNCTQGSSIHDFSVEGKRAPKTLGVQSVYIVDGVETRSELVTAETSGVNGIAAEGADVVSEEYYNLDGMRIGGPCRGISLRKVTYSDGTVKVLKEAVR